MTMKTVVLLAALSATLGCAASGDDSFPVRGLYVLQWDCTGDCDLVLPYSDYERADLQTPDEGSFELTFYGDSCDQAAVACELRSEPCGDGGAQERLECGSLAACDGSGESLPELVICPGEAPDLVESEELTLADPGSGEEATVQLRGQVFVL